MRANLKVCCLGLSLLGSGCSLAVNATRVVCSRVNETVEDCAERQRNKRWAEAAWRQILAEHPGAGFSADYGKGFRDGFAEHLYRGTTSPPALPPARYRALGYQNPRGYQAVEDWFAGFRHGIDVAQAGGFRDYVTGPTSLRAPLAVPLPPAQPSHWTELAPRPEPTPLPVPTPLPAGPAAAGVPAATPQDPGLANPPVPADVRQGQVDACGPSRKSGAG